MSWDASPSQGVEGYKIYISLNPDMTNPIAAVDATGTLTQTVVGLVDNEHHYFAVTAYKGTEESVFSNIVHSPPEVEPPPAEQLPGTINNLQWNVE